jgi:sugar-specific transcriptional regulator TrmB
MNQQEIDNLVRFGFTQLEAQIYITLLESPNITGYRIAQILGKPMPNTYKALNNLKGKNIITADESAKKQIFSALPIEDYLNFKELEFKKNRAEVEEQLKHYEAKKMEGGISRIINIENVFSCAQKMIADAEKIILLDVFPRPLESIITDLRVAAERQVRIIVKAYKPVRVDGCEIIYSETDSNLPDRFLGDWMNMVVDSKESLLSYVSMQKNRVFEAFWCNNVFLSILLHNGFHHELVLSHIKEEMKDTGLYSGLEDIINHYEGTKTTVMPAFQAFLSKFIELKNDF